VRGTYLVEKRGLVEDGLGLSASSCSRPPTRTVAHTGYIDGELSMIEEVSDEAVDLGLRRQAGQDLDPLNRLDLVEQKAGTVDEVRGYIVNIGAASVLLHGPRVPQLSDLAAIS